MESHSLPSVDSFTGLQQRLGMSRRDVLKYAALSVATGSCSGWLSSLATASANQGVRPPKQCIALWTTGGLSQLETFDVKPRYSMFPGIATSVPGMRIGDRLPRLS